MNTFIEGSNYGIRVDYGTNSEEFKFGDLELINDNKINMNIIEKFAALFMGEPLKTFVEVGIKTKENTLTEDGKTILLELLSKDNEGKLLEIANKLKEEKKD